MILDKLLEKFMIGLDYVIDPKNKTIIITILIILGIIWASKNNSLID